MANEPTIPQRRWFWATLMLSSITIVSVVFAAWELVENRLFRDADYITLHYLYITRGILSSLLLAFWAAWFVLRQRRSSDEQMARSRERYRGLLDASPAAIALYDESLQVLEWNASAERLYGWCKEEAIGSRLPTLPAGKQEEFDEFLSRAAAGVAVRDIETQRCGRDGVPVNVELSLLPFQEAGGPRCFLEVTADISERIRLRQTLIEVEKLTTMGRMAAGTAHHLNTPLAAMLLRVQMMRDQATGRLATDLARLEENIGFCQQFVRRLLEFSRPMPIQKQPEQVTARVESVLSFLSPSILAKRAHVTSDLNDVNGSAVLADRNQFEALLLILLSNSLDAIGPAGNITVRCRRPAADRIEIQVGDDGCGIDSNDLPHVFEPFFSTKGPGKGTGLGLAIARNIVSEHGGELRLQSAPRLGTVATITLPLHQRTAPMPVSGEAVPETARQIVGRL